MKIGDVTSMIARLAGKEKKEVDRNSPPDKKKVSKDALELSTAAGHVKELVSRALQVPDETERVTALKQQIASGEYVVDSKELARKMLSGEEPGEL
jgi:flagellar biosynthesis anti-sigma factor FlgM